MDGNMETVRRLRQKSDLPVDISPQGEESDELSA